MLMTADVLLVQQLRDDPDAIVYTFARICMQHSANLNLQQ